MPSYEATELGQSLKGSTSADTLNDAQFDEVTLNGDAGNDLYIVNSISTVVIDSAGVDTIQSGLDFSISSTPSIESLVLTDGAVFGSGNSGANRIVGTDNGVTLVGLQGNDTLIGGAGDDLLYASQQTEKLGTVVTDLDLSSLIESGYEGDYGALVAFSDGSIIAQSNQDGEIAFVKVSKTGVLDTTFAGDGVLGFSEINFLFGDPFESGVDASAATVTLLSDGRFLISGLTKDGFEAYARLNASGALDNTFGSAGFFIPESFINPDNGESLLVSLGNGVDGILVAKSIESETTSGTRFQIFSNDGKSTGISSIISSENYDFISLSNDPNVQMQSGKAVIFGAKADQSAPVLVRLTAAGALDTAFGTSGFLTLNSAYDYTNAIFDVRADAIYVSGAVALDQSEPSSAIMRFTANGAGDTGFGNAGVLTLSDMVGGGVNARILSDGRTLQQSSSPEGTVFKIHAKDGKSFVETNAIPMEYDGITDYPEYPASSALVQGTKIVLEGRSAGDLSPMLIRLNADGTLDTSFGADGYFTAPETEMGESFDFSGFQVSVLADGKLLATGIKQTTQYGESAIVVRLTADGKYDTSFGVNGILASEPGEGGVDFRVLSNGAIILVDGSLEGSSVTMFSKDGKLDLTFGSDPTGTDSLVGGDGNDTLVSGAGVTTMIGGLGNDKYVVNNSANILVENATDEGGGIDTIYTTFSFNLGANSLAAGVENLIYTGSGASLAGNALANYIEGDFGNDTITLGKDDTVDGFGGNDLYIVNDTLTASTMHLVKTSEVGDDFRDTLRSAVSFDLRAALDEGRVINVDNLVYTSTLGGNLRGTGWDGIIVGNTGNDTLSDGTGDTSLEEAGTVTLVGGAGNDRYMIENPNVVIVESSLNGGTDTVESKSDFSLSQGANVENLVLSKADEADATYGEGNAGANSIVGNDQSNTLVGLQGSDTIVGGAGNDMIFAAQATARLGTIVVGGLDLSSLVTPDMDGDFGFLGVQSLDGAMVAQVEDEDGTYFIKVNKTGVVDAAFGNGGSVTPLDVFGDSAESGVDASMASVTMLADGKFFVSGLTKDGEEAYARVNANGILDTGFGTAGFFVPKNSLGSGEEILAVFGNGVDGFLVAKTGSTTLNDVTTEWTKFQVFSKDGALVGAGTGELSSTAYDFSSLTMDPNVQVQGSKGVVIVGANLGVDAEQNPTSVPVLLRLTNAGGLDTNFGASGYMTLSGVIGSVSYDYANASFEVRSTGIYVTGVAATSGETTQEAVMSFSADGKSPVVVTFAAEDDVQDVKILADGRILAVINVLDADTQEPLGTKFKIYGANSQTVVSSAVLPDYFSSLEEITVITQAAATVTDPANVIIGGWDDESMSPVSVRLIGKTGALDTSFGVGGYLQVADLVSLDEGVTLNFDNMDLQVLAGGQFLLTGITQMDEDGERALIVRLTKDGKFDTTFGVNGVLSSEVGAGLRVLSNSTIIEVGADSEYDESSVTLYNANGKVETNFGSDTLGADSLVGGAGDDTIVGGAGAATMDGGLGDDFYVVNNSATVIRESTLPGNSTLEGFEEVPLNGIDTVATSVNYTLGSGLENLVAMGGIGLFLAGNSGANSIEGTYGNDTIFAGAGDTVSGGGGQDRYIVQHESALVEGNEEGFDTLLSASSYDLNNATNIANLIYTGTAGATLTGNGGAGSIIGGAGADTLRDGGDGTASEFGATTLVGGAGNDCYELSNSEVVIVEASNGGSDTVVSDVDYSLSQAANVENLALSGEASLGLGNAGANSIVGNDNGNTLVGLQGADTIRGGTGDDLIFGGNATFAIGRLSLSSTGENDSPYILKDGSILTIAEGDEGQSIMARYSKSGVLNTSFGVGGYATLPDGISYPSDIFYEQADGKLIVYGWDEVEETPHLVRYTASGQMDATFGQNGILTAPNAETIQSWSLNWDGSMFAVTSNGDSESLRRFTKDGKLDAPFAGNAGKINLPPGIRISPYETMTLRDGSLLLSGENEDGISVFVRYNKNGSLNTGFGADGILLAPEGVQDPWISEQVGGKLRLSGSFYEEYESSMNNLVGSYKAQYTANGQLDATFGVGGVLTAPVGGASQDFLNSSDGSIYAWIDEGEDGSIIRYNKDGKLDLTFAGNSGKITSPLGISFNSYPSSSNILKDGGFILRGGNEAGNSILARYSKDGMLNASFGASGVITLPEGIFPVSISEQADGKLRLSGSLYEQGEFNMEWAGWYVAQYTAAGQLDTTFGVGGVLTAPTGSIIQKWDTATDGTIFASISEGDQTSFIRYSKDGKLDMTYAGDTVGDTLIGGDGNDTLVSGVAVSSLVGGSGDDAYFINNSGTVINDTAGMDTVYTTANFDLSKFNSIENLVFANGIGGASLIGNSLANSIVGDASNDTINGGSGADAMAGDAGNDLYIVDNEGDTTEENEDEGIDTVSVTATLAQLPDGYTLAANVENLILGGNASLSGYGNELNNRMTGNSANNILDGAEGDNTLDGGVGRDTLRAGSGDDYFIVDNTLDVIEDAGGYDSVEARVANYALAEGLESLVLGAGIASGAGNAENNILVGNSVANTLRGLDGDDTLDGGLGADSLVGGNGDDYYIVDNVGDRVTESTVDGGSAGGIDTVLARVTGYTLANGVENLVLFGTVASGTGNSLDNMITGNSVANTLNGGTGADAMTGGAGNDLYIVDNAGDTIEENEDEGIDTVSVTATVAQLPDGYTLAANVENLILGGNASLSGYGNELNNRMTGNTANNLLEGGEGNNTLDGGVGRDTLRAGSGDDYFIVDNTLDVIEDAGGYDSVEARVANYALAEGLESLVLGAGIASGAGNAENNILFGNSVANTLQGLDGDDTLDGGLGADLLVGGNGDDYYIVDNVGDRVTESTVDGGSAGGIDTVLVRVTGYTLANGVENLVLFGTVASGTGNSLDNSIAGNSVANTLNGGIGADAMSGGAGNDLYIVDNAGDTIEELEDEGIDTVSVTATLLQLPEGYTLASNIENLTLGGTQSLSGYGNELNNRMTGNSANNILEGGEGNNTLDGGVGKDTLLAGSGDDYFIVDNTLDVIEDAGGYDTVEARINNYTLAGGMEVLRLAGTAASAFGNEGDNLLVGSSLANTLRGMEGNDTLDGGAGVDSLIGGAGDDYYIIDNAGDRVFETSNEGIDTVEARVTGYTLANGVENLVLFGVVASGTGNSLDNFLIGNAANNSLNGAVGSDTLSAAGSNRGVGQRDTLTGGAGNDVFILADENGSFYDDGTSSSTGVADFAYITDFNASQDSLVLSGSAEEYSLVSGIPAGVTGITGTGHYGLFRDQSSTDELVAVIKTANTTILSSGNTIDLAQFVSPIG